MTLEFPENEATFPDPRLIQNPDGCIGCGGELTTEWLTLAYSLGIFPWFAYHYHATPIWYCPMQRFVLYPDEVHISHSMRALLNKQRYRVTIDTDFSGVINGCRTIDHRDQQGGAWLSEDIVAAYTELHRLGIAHSVEVWDGERLVGGLYGVQIEKCFMGESMFALERDTSKLALIYLAQHAAEHNISLIDCQVHSPHLESMGARTIDYEEFLSALGCHFPPGYTPIITRDVYEMWWHQNL